MTPAVSGQSVICRRSSRRALSPGRFHAYLAIVPLILISGIGMAMGARITWVALAGCPATSLEKPLSIGVCLLAIAIALLALAAASLRMWLRMQEVEKVHAQIVDSHEEAMKEARRYRRQVEALSLMREIHRTGNIASPEERLRQTLAALADATGLREATIYSLDPETSAPRPAATYRSSDGSTLFVLLKTGAGIGAGDGGDGDGRHWSRGVSCGKLSVERRDRNLTISGDICRGEMRIGCAWLRVCGDGRPAILSQDPADLLESALRETDIECGQAAEVLEHRRLLRRLDAGKRRLDLALPLNAERRVVGAMRARLDAVADDEHAAWIESVLVEASDHIGLALKKEQDSIEAATDGLTGLFVKRRMLSDLARMIAESSESGRSLCLLMFDIDHFKKINDTWGHLTGDKVLKGVAKTLLKSLRANDAAYRYGGEELAVALPNTTVARAAQAAERIRAAIAAEEFFAGDGTRVPVTISIGVADIAPDIRTPEALIARADAALYASKRGGRNRVTVWSQEPAAQRA
ncbi:MAG: GGDEF domain-containing protein [Planctomycetota bacterium]|nr:GGDEF domain-containing protein [Planctomycetota bacterium]